MPRTHSVRDSRPAHDFMRAVPDPRTPHAGALRRAKSRPSPMDDCDALLGPYRVARAAIEAL